MTKWSKFLFRIVGFLTVLFVLWVVPVHMTYSDEATPWHLYRLEDKTYLALLASRWEWKTNLLCYGFGIVTVNLIGGLLGPESQSHKLVYRLDCSKSELVLDAPGSMGEIFIYRGQIHFANTQYRWNRKQREESPRLYSGDGKHFVPVPTQLPSEEWIKRADAVFTCTLLKSNRDDKWSLDICNQNVILQGSKYGQRVTLRRGETKETLFKAREDSLKIGW